MPGAKRFTDLLIWQRSRAWSKAIFAKTQAERFCRDQRLVVQVNDSSESVMANIAEGFGRGTQGEFVTFLGYALGSLNETQSHLCAAYDRCYLPRADFASSANDRHCRPQTARSSSSLQVPGSVSLMCDASALRSRARFSAAACVALPATKMPALP